MSNEEVIAEYLRETGVKWVSVAWVVWALKSIESANQRGVGINPEYLRASHRFVGDDKPAML